MKLQLESLIKIDDTENRYKTTLLIGNREILIDLDPDDVDINDTISLANKVLKDFKKFELNARENLISEFLDTYNESWLDDENPELSAEEFNENLKLTAINFLSNMSFDFFYTENGMFGNHTLISQSFDGENFEGGMMFG